MAWTYLLIHDVVCIASGTYLIVYDHPWWAVVPFALAATTTVRNRKND